MGNEYWRPSVSCSCSCTLRLNTSTLQLQTDFAERRKDNRSPYHAGRIRWTNWQDLTRFDKIWQDLTRFDKKEHQKYQNPTESNCRQRPALHGEDFLCRRRNSSTSRVHAPHMSKNTPGKRSLVDIIWCYCISLMCVEEFVISGSQPYLEQPSSKSSKAMEP